MSCPLQWLGPTLITENTFCKKLSTETLMKSMSLELPENDREYQENPIHMLVLVLLKHLEAMHFSKPKIIRKEAGNWNLDEQESSWQLIKTI